MEEPEETPVTVDTTLSPSAHPRPCCTLQGQPDVDHALNGEDVRAGLQANLRLIIRNSAFVFFCNLPGKERELQVCPVYFVLPYFLSIPSCYDVGMLLLCSDLCTGTLS